MEETTFSGCLETKRPIIFGREDIADLCTQRNLSALLKKNLLTASSLIKCLVFRSFFREQATAAYFLNIQVTTLPRWTEYSTHLTSMSMPTYCSTLHFLFSHFSNRKIAILELLFFASYFELQCSVH